MRIRGILPLPPSSMNAYEYKLCYMYQIEYLHNVPVAFQISCLTPAKPPCGRLAGVGQDGLRLGGDGGGLTRSSTWRGVELSQVNDV